MVGHAARSQFAQPELEQPVRSPARLAHALALRAPTHHQVQLLLDGARAIHRHWLRLGRELAAEPAGAVEALLVRSQLRQKLVDLLPIAVAHHLSELHLPDQGLRLPS